MPPQREGPLAAVEQLLTRGEGRYERERTPLKQLCRTRGIGILRLLPVTNRFWESTTRET